MAKVIVYSTRICPYCVQAKRLLQNQGIDFEEIDLSSDYDKRDELSQKYNWQTVPMIVIGEDFIGGFNELYALKRDGKLKTMVGA